MRVNREALLQSLEALTPGLAAREVIEQSQCYVFHGDRITTFNDEILCEVVNPLEDVNGAVPSKPLISLLRRMAEDEIDVVAAEGELQIRGKRKRAGIRVESELLLPVEDIEMPKKDKWQKLPADFSDAVDMVYGCADVDESNFALTCVHITPHCLEAWDGFQAIRWMLETGVKRECLVRSSSLKHVVRLGMTQVATTKSWIYFRNPAGLTFGCRRWQEDYQKLDGILEVSGTKAVLPGGLEEVVSKADVFSSDGIAASAVTVGLKPGKLRLRGEGLHGWYEERVNVKYNGKPLSFQIAPKLLIELSKKSNECEITKERLKLAMGKFVFVACLEEAGE